MVAPLPLTPLTAVDFLNAAFDRLRVAEERDRAHDLDAAAAAYSDFLTRVQTFLDSPLAPQLAAAEVIDPGDLRGMLPGVQLRYERLCALQRRRDAPPVPGAVPLTGPGAAATLVVDPVAARDLSGRAAAAAAAAGVGAGGGGAAGGAPTCGDRGATADGSAHESVAQRLEKELLAASGAAAAAAARAATAAAAAPGQTGEQAQGASGVDGEAAGGGHGDTRVCAACGAAGRWGGNGTAGGDASGMGGPGGELPALLRCGRCRNAFYCSAACQRRHWPTHKAACRTGPAS